MELLNTLHLQNRTVENDIVFGDGAGGNDFSYLNFHLDCYYDYNTGSSIYTDNWLEKRYGTN